LGIYPSFSVSSQGHQRSINQAWGWYTILDCTTNCLTKWRKKGNDRSHEHQSNKS
jgi:hypothetical protein